MPHDALDSLNVHSYTIEQMKLIKWRVVLEFLVEFLQIEAVCLMISKEVMRYAQWNLREPRGAQQLRMQRQGLLVGFDKASPVQGTVHAIKGF